MIGQLENELRAKGLDRNTYFVFSSDNGFHMGEYTLTSGKQTAFETDIRVPLIVSGPGVPAGRDVSQLTSSIDLAPTFETLAGLPVPASVDGHSLAGLWHGQDPVGWPLAVLIEHHGPDFSPDDPDRQTSRPGTRRPTRRCGPPPRSTCGTRAARRSTTTPRPTRTSWTTWPVRAFPTSSATRSAPWRTATAVPPAGPPPSSG